MTVQDEVTLEARPIYLRGYVVREKKPKQGAFDPEAEEVDRVPPSEWSLTFDCETTTDAAQSLRFGAYQLREDGELIEHGLFHSEDINDADLAVLADVAKTKGLRLRTVRHFVDYVLFAHVYAKGGVVVGFNLPFDLSRIAIKHGSARRSMRGGFSFTLSKNNDWPRLRVKHVSSKMAFIRYGAPPKKRTPNSQHKRGIVIPPSRGSFVDVKTLASGLLSGSHSLLTLSRDTLKVDHPKLDVDQHGGPLTAEYVAYGLRDVQATWECYDKLTKKLAGYGLTTIEPKTLYSEASLGKAYLKQMGVKPWRDLQPDFPPEKIGQIVSTYFGGRAEVHIRRERRQVLYCDFLSMYPTVCTLMGLWRFVIGKGVVWRDTTAETQALLDRIDAADMMMKPAWHGLTTLVQLKPDDDILPIRARYGDEASSNIGVNRMSSDQPLWFTLADVIAAKVLSGVGKTPLIARAIRFDPMQMQDELQSIAIAGNPEFRVNPANNNEDFYRRVIDLRQDVKAKRDGKPKGGDEWTRLDGEQLALKILANATSYGIFIEMIVKDLEKAETLNGYGVDGRAFDVYTKKYEEPGFYFHPLLATLITGAARLMLALAERRARDEGLDWVFCDTDSIAMAKPGGMERAEFLAAARRVCAAFAGLNPYARATGSILQIEEQNYAADDRDKAHLDAAPPLYCFAVSAKRYALFNLDATGEAVIRKASAHGLGHLLAPYSDPDKKRSTKRLKDINVDLWQQDLWKRIIAAAEEPDKTEGGVVIDLEGDTRLAKPVASRYAATTPALIDWFKIHNRGKPYQGRVRPFGFLLSLQSEKMEQIAHQDEEAQAWWQKYKSDPAAAAPFDVDPAKAAQEAFDRRRRDKKIPERWLKTYADALSDYHLQPEPKFLGGEIRRSSGALHRRHVKASVVQHIGKESDQYEEQLYTGENNADLHYGLTPEARGQLVKSIAWARNRFSVRKFTTAARASDRTVANAVKGKGSDATLVRLNEVANRLMTSWTERRAEEVEDMEWALERAAMEGSYRFAARIGVDAANLSRALKGKRKVSAEMLAKIRIGKMGE